MSRHRGPPLSLGPPQKLFRLGLFCLPAIIAYFWFFLPLLAVTGSINYCLAHRLFKLLHRIHADQGNLGDTMMVDMQAAETIEQRRQHLENMKWREYQATMKDDSASKLYMVNHESFRLTGVLQVSWNQYVGAASFIPATLVFAAPMAARLYTGQGYMSSLQVTLDERHLASYIVFLWSSLGAKLKSLSLFL